MGEREKRQGHRGQVVWMYGLSGSGKSTLAVGLEKRLFEAGRNAVVLDGDNLRQGLNRNLGFSDEDRLENVRRVSEVARLLCGNGIVAIVSLICPAREMRELARGVVGKERFLEVFVDASLEVCEQRDVKGLYAKAKVGKIKQFTGRDSSFERPESPDLHLKTDGEDPLETLDRLWSEVGARIAL